MIIYQIKPLLPDGEVPRDLEATSVYAQLFQKPARSVTQQQLRTESELTTPDGFTLRIIRRSGSAADEHPVDALFSTLTELRSSHQDHEMRIPGQAFSNSFTAEATSATEGVVVVLCGIDDWQRPRIDTELDWDPVPSLRRLDDRDRLVDYRGAEPGSYITADSRGMIIDYERDFDHSDFLPDEAENVSDEEAAPFLVQFAIQHAVRTYDITRAAQCIDVLGDRRATAQQREEALALLRVIQVRIAARGLESLLENHSWQSFIGHDAFRMQQIIRQESARIDRDLSRQFTGLQPVIEASAAEQSARELSRITRVTSWAGALLGGVALVGLFAALAAIPNQGATFEPFPRAAFVAVAVGAAVAGYALALNYLLARGHGPTRAGGKSWRVGGVILIAAAVVLALRGSLNPDAATAGLLTLSLLLLALGVLSVTYGYNPEARDKHDS